MRLSRFLLTALLIGALPCPLYAWNSVGHLAIAKLAYDELEDAHKAKIYRLLKVHPHYDHFLAVGRPEEVSEVEWVVLRAAVWPDWVRIRPSDPRGPGVTRFHRGEEHYVNIPFIDPKDVEFFGGKTLISPDLTNIVCSLKQRCNDLQTKSAADEDRAVALCWIFHLVGDIHQPMHNVSYFSQQKAFQKGDLGGNKFGIRVAGRKWKLHAYWDDVLGEDPRYLDDSNQRQRKIHQAAVTLAESLRGRQMSPAERDALEQHRTFASWSEEGAELAKTVAYRRVDGTLIAGVEVQFDGSMPDTAPEVGDDYAKRARAIAETRALLAGKRLAERLRMLLAK